MEKMRAYAEQVFFSLANPSEYTYLVRIVLNLLCTRGTERLKIYLTMPVLCSLKHNKSQHINIYSVLYI
jgi:hypothetical protein